MQCICVFADHSIHWRKGDFAIKADLKDEEIFPVKHKQAFGPRLGIATSVEEDNAPLTCRLIGGYLR